MRTRRLFIAIAAVGLLAAGPLAAPAAAAPPDQADFIEAFERDVFVIVGASLRNPDATTDPSERLYNVAGVGLGVTWGEWQAGSAASRVQVSGGKSPTSNVRLQLSGLVPGGVYSVFWATIGPDSEHPQCQGVERSLPLIGARQNGNAPDPSSFVAGDDGTAEYRGEAPGDLLSATQVFFSVIYHANGQTYHPFPNAGEFLTHDDGEGNCRSSYGHDAMRQFLVLQKW
jgi:hypothetical protein